MQPDELRYEQFHYGSKLKLITDILNDTPTEPDKNKEEVIKIIDSFSGAESALFRDNLSEDSSLSEKFRDITGEEMELTPKQPIVSNPIEYFKNLLKAEALRRLEANIAELPKYREKYDTLSEDGDDKNWENIIKIRKQYEKLNDDIERTYKEKCDLENAIYWGENKSAEYSEIKEKYKKLKEEKRQLERTMPGEARFFNTKQLYKREKPTDSTVARFQKYFDQIAKAQIKLKKKINDDEIALWKIQPVIESVMPVAMLTLTPEQLDEVVSYIKKQKIKDFSVTIGLTVLSVASGIALFFITGGTATILSLAGATVLAGTEIATDIALSVKKIDEARDTKDLVYAGSVGEKFSDQATRLKP